jgi:hypothetical protein
VTAVSPAFGVVAPAERASFPRVYAWLAACATCETFAATILLSGAALPAPVACGAAAALHVAAVLLAGAASRMRPDRRPACIAAVLAIPLAGAAVATVLLVTQGRRAEHGARRRTTPRPLALTAATLVALANTPSPCDALAWGDEDERRAAFSVLSRRADPEAIALLRRTAAGRDPDVALAAALALDEIGERIELRPERLAPPQVRRAAR